MAAPVVGRGWAGALIDRCATWAWSLPPESCSYAVQRLRIPLHDAVEVVADLYTPALPKPLGTVLVRSPYTIGLLMAVGAARIYAARGYQVLLSANRGTDGSEGEFRPAQDDIKDGHAVVAWMRKQPWYTGSFATLGGSYLAWAQWALLTDPPPDLKAVNIHSGPHDFSQYLWTTGALNTDMISWGASMTYAERGGWLPPPIHMMWNRKRMFQVLQEAPLHEAVRKYVGGDVPLWLENMISRSQASESASAALDKVSIPIMITAGWDDVMLEQAMEQYEALSRRGCDVTLTVGKWDHMEAQGSMARNETLDWLAEHLAGTKKRTRAPVRIFVTGADEWRDMQEWPPKTSPLALHLGASNELSEGADSSADTPGAKSFEFNPTEPTPTLGAAMLNHMGGKREDDGALATRADVLAFTTAPLDRDVEVLGKPAVELYHSTDHPQADILVRLSEVDPKGASHNVCERYLRLPEDRSDDGSPLKLSLGDCAHRFRKGYKIRLVVAGGAHPRYVRNLGTGDDPATGAALRSVTHTVRLGASAPSVLVLPISQP